MSTVRRMLRPVRKYENDWKSKQNDSVLFHVFLRGFHALSEKQRQQGICEELKVALILSSMSRIALRRLFLNFPCSLVLAHG
jgi:hypothetical protein